MANRNFELLSSAESRDYLGVSIYKFKKLISDEILIPYSEVKSSFGRSAHLFEPKDLMKVKRLIQSEGYKYIYA